jgi:hypothetical protein
VITGLTCETITRTYTVTDEGPADVPYSIIKIIADTLEITYTRDANHAWRVRSMEITGYRAKNDGRPGANHAQARWYDSRRDNGALIWGGDCQPPGWALAIAARDLPQGGPLAPIAAPVTPAELDN